MALRIVARRRSCSAHFLEDGRCGIARDDRHGNNDAACCFDLFPADDLIAGPIAALDKHVGEKCGNDFARRGLAENHDAVHALKRGKNFRAFVFWKNRPTRAFEFSDARVAIDANDKRFAEGAGLFEALNVTGMEQVKAAVGENDAASIAFLAAKPQNRFLYAENARMQKFSPRSDGQVA